MMQLRIQLCILASLFAVGSAIISQPGCCDDPRICRPRVITNCPRKNVTEACPTCCCDSTENIEFYDPDHPEPWCSAPPAVYTVTFVSTWSLVCNPDYYFSDAHWSPPTGVSHNTGYQMWDACMENVSPGVAQVSQIGATRLIEGEWAGNSSHILDSFKGVRIDGVGNVSRDLSVDKFHQWVSAITMLAPSVDRMVGVANLRLCDGTDWKRTVKVCSELFSTATRSERVHPRMQRNSIQWNNCSFGYFKFTFKEYKNASQEVSNNAEIFEAGTVCPATTDNPFKNYCRTCCCQPSPGVDFYRPYAASQTKCSAKDDAEYKVSLIPTLSDTCHSTTPFPDNSEFSELLLASHFGFQLFTREITENDPFYPYILYPEFALPLAEVALEDEVKRGILHDFFTPDMIEADSDKRRRVGEIKVTPYYKYVSLMSLIGMNNWVGFSGLNLCGPQGWKKHLEVCLPLMAAVNKTESPDSPTEVQGDNCAFAVARFDRIDRPAAKCTPNDESVFSIPDLPLSACCYCEFILEGQVIRVTERFGDSRYLYNLLVKVTTVHYDELGHIEAGDVVTIKVCSLPFRIKFRRLYRLTGARELGTNELEISERGIVGNIPELSSGPLGAGPCPPFILGGNCDDPR